MSEFWRLVDEEFGDGYGRVVVDGHSLGALDHRTGTEALSAGVPVRTVWKALCLEMDVPQERWLGRDLPLREGGRGD